MENSSIAFYLVLGLPLIVLLVFGFIVRFFNKEARDARNQVMVEEGVYSITFIEVLFYVLAGISLFYLFIYGWMFDYDSWTGEYKFKIITETYIGFGSFVFNLFCANIIMWLRKIYNRLCQ